MYRAVLISNTESFNRELSEKLISFGYSVCRFEQYDLQHNHDDFIVVDMDAIGIDYNELQTLISEYHFSVLAFSGLPRFNQAVQLLKIGIKGYLSRYTEKLNMSHAIRSVLDGGMWFDPGVMQELISNIRVSETFANNESSLLSDREQQIASYVSKGIANKEIALQLDITERTVKAHILSCYQKVGVHDRVSLALWAKRALNV